MTSPTYRFHRTRHSAQRVDQRNLSDESIKNVVYYGIRTRIPGRPEHGGKVFLFKKRVDGTTLTVVAEIKDSDCWIITSYESK